MAKGLSSLNPEKRNQNLFCRYHKEVGHNTDDFIQLKNEIEYLIKQGKLNKYTKDRNNDNQDNRDNQKTEIIMKRGLHHEVLL